MVFSRQGMPNMDTTSTEGCAKGAYVVHDSEGTPDCILIGELGGSGLRLRLAQGGFEAGTYCVGVALWLEAEAGVDCGGLAMALCP